MSQVVLHTQDNEKTSQQINTTTLSLKSIVGNEKKHFNSLTQYEDNLLYVQKNTINIIRRLTNIINNLYKACDILIGLQSAIYVSDNRVNALNTYGSNIEYYYSQIPDSFFDIRGGRL